jgi:hypothetical protein
MKYRARIEFIRNCSDFIMLSNPYFGEVLEFKLLSILYSADKAVIVIKHAGQVLFVTRGPKDLRAQSILKDINLISVKQLSGQSIPRLSFIIELYSTNKV